MKQKVPLSLSHNSNNEEEKEKWNYIEKVSSFSLSFPWTFRSRILQMINVYHCIIKKPFNFELNVLMSLFWKIKIFNFCKEILWNISPWQIDEVIKTKVDSYRNWLEKWERSLINRNLCWLYWTSWWAVKEKVEFKN